MKSFGRGGLWTAVLALWLVLVLGACGGKEKAPLSGGGAVAPGGTGPAAVDIPEPPAEDIPQGPAEPAGGESSSAEAPEEDGGIRFTVGMAEADGTPLEGTVELSVRLPEGWTVSGSVICNEEGRQVAEALPCLPFPDESVFDRLAERYPDGDPVKVTLGGLSGRYYYDQTTVAEGPFAGTFENHILYFLEQGELLVCIRFDPAPGGGIGTQREQFQKDILSVRVV